MRDLSLAIPQGIGKKRSNTSSSTYRLNLSILVATMILAFSYLFVVNSLGTKGYDIKKLDQQVRVLEDQQKSLQMQASDLQSIIRIQTQAEKLNFVPATNVTYLRDADFALK